MAREKLSTTINKLEGMDAPTQSIKRVQDEPETKRNDGIMAMAESFAYAKIQEDIYKKQASELNSKLKEKMNEEEASEIKLSSGTLKLINGSKTVVDHELLLKTVKELGFTPLIRVTESVNMELLESLLYNNELSADATEALSVAFSEQETQQLRFTKAKGAK